MLLSSLYKILLKPVLFTMEPEEAHDLAHRMALGCGALWSGMESLFAYRGDDLQVKLSDIELSNPVGLAAGFDKNGQLVEQLGHLGFGFAEIGSVTAQACLGNPKPRLFRLPDDQAIINRMGLNGEGADCVAQRLLQAKFSLPIGINIAKTNDELIIGDAAIEDILYSFNQIKELPIAFVTINVSCPNTHNGIIKEAKELSELLSEIQKANQRSLQILVKLSPDSDDELIDSVVESANKYGLSGFVCGNTSSSRLGLKTDSQHLAQIGAGGLSGYPIKKLAIDLCRKVYKRKQSKQFVIGVGGISTAQDAYDFVLAGASAIELYTGLVYEGPTLPRQINQGLSKLLARDGVTLAQAVGSQIT